MQVKKLTAALSTAAISTAANAVNRLRPGKELSHGTGLSPAIKGDRSGQAVSRYLLRHALSIGLKPLKSTCESTPVLLLPAQARLWSYTVSHIHS